MLCRSHFGLEIGQSPELNLKVCHVSLIFVFH